MNTHTTSWPACSGKAASCVCRACCIARAAPPQRPARALFIGVNGDLRRHEDFTLKGMQAAVGGLVEVVHIPEEMAEFLTSEDAPRAVLLVNEEGRLTGLQRNELASAIAGVTIHGPAVLVANSAAWGA